MKEQIQEWRKKNPLRKWRDRQFLSQGDVAASVGVGYHTVCDWETGKVVPSEKQFEMLSGLGLKTIKRAWQLWLNGRPKIGGTSGNK